MNKDFMKKICNILILRFISWR